jgi:hypothetical protein
VSRARQRSFRSVFRRLTLSLRCRSVHRAARLFQTRASEHLDDEAAEGPDVGFAGVRGLLDDLGSHPVAFFPLRVPSTDSVSTLQIGSSSRPTVPDDISAEANQALVRLG